MRLTLTGATAPLILATLATLAGCGSSPRTPAPPAKPAPAAPPVAAAPAPHVEPKPVAPAASAPAPKPPSPLAAEQRWLEQLFEGTPVRISSESDGNALQVLVPVAFSFDGESTKPKPALQAVLDKVSQSLKRQPNSRLRVSAPGPAARALAARQHLLSRGVAAHRVEATTTSNGDGVQLLLSLAPASGASLRDGGSPVSARRSQ